MRFSRNLLFNFLLFWGLFLGMSVRAETNIEDPATDQPTLLNVADFGVFPDGSDSTVGLQRALAACLEQGAVRLIFPKGEYHFYPAFAKECYLFVSNNDEGLKRVIFPLVGYRDLVVDGQGSNFVFHGFVNPFLIQNAAGIELRDFSIDFSRPFHSEGIVVSNGEDFVDLRIPEPFPYEVSRGLLRFVPTKRVEGKITSVSEKRIYGSGHILEFDTERRETAFMAKDYFFQGTSSYAAKDLGGGIVRLMLPGITAKVGNTLVFGPSHRDHPGFVLDRASDIDFRSVTIHHAGGMGIIAQNSHNIRVSHCRVTPSPGRMLSTTADATHFVNCTGYIELTDNLFENQKDDATNIHGIYAQIVRITGGNEILVRLVHHQQHGFELIEAGGELELVKAKSLKTIGTAVVTEVDTLNKEYTRVVLDRPLPEGLREGDVVAAIRDYPEVTIARNIIRNNRARGMLLNSRGKTLVEDNFFHTPGAAILFEGDASFWFEQGGVSDCTIRGNVFENCLFGVWGVAVIDVQVGIREEMETSRYNRNILIENNHFRVFDDASLLNAYCVEGLTWRNNTVERTEAYAPLRDGAPRFRIRHSDAVSIDEPFELNPTP